MKKAFLKILPILIFFIFLSFPVLAVEIRIENPLQAESLEDLIYGIIDFIWKVATAVVPLMIVIAGFYFLTAAGNPQQIDTAKKIILYTVVGYAIIMLSAGLILVIKDILGGG